MCHMYCIYYTFCVILSVCVSTVEKQCIFACMYVIYVCMCVFTCVINANNELLLV